MSGVDEGTGVDDGGSFYSSSSTSIIPFIDLFLRQKRKNFTILDFFDLIT